MTRPESLFEAASYDLNKFRERRMADRRFMARDTPDRRKASMLGQNVDQEQSAISRDDGDQDSIQNGERS